jgi:hypothetical protein
MIPHWLHLLAIVSRLAGLACAIIVVLDEMRHPQMMWIMNVVWPVNALFASVIALWAYYRFGRLKTRDAKDDSDAATPFAVKVGKGAAHCGSGCTIGDILAEWIAFFVPAVAIWLGWKSIFDEKIFAVWIADYILAFAFGIAFQYFTIKPMRDLAPGPALVAAVKADFLSLSAWQIGMYGFMAIAHFWIFKLVLGVPLEVASPEFWFMMQIAMLAGFVTSYPVNWWLLRKGIKESM